MTTLPVESFPHIAKAIFAYAPRNSRLVLRAVCKQLRQQVDVYERRHLVATQHPEGHYHLAFHDPNGLRIACLYEWNCARRLYKDRKPERNERRRERRHLIGEESKSSSSNQARRNMDIYDDDHGQDTDYDSDSDSKDVIYTDNLRSIEDSIKEDIQILDIVTPMNDDYAVDFASDIPARLVRKMAQDTKYDIDDLAGNDATDVLFKGEGYSSYVSDDATEEAVLFSSWQHVEESDNVCGVVGSLPISARRAVVNVLYGEDACVTYEAISATGVEDLVVLFTPTEHQHHNDPEEPEYPLGYLANFFSDAIMYIETIKITLVDMVNIPPYMLSASPNLSREERAAHIRRMFVDFAQIYHIDEDFADDQAAVTRAVNESLRFLTMAEYRAEVGEGQYALETIPSKVISRTKMEGPSM